MSWELIAQIAVLVLLGAIAILIGSAIWNSMEQEKHKRALELIEHHRRGPGA